MAQYFTRMRTPGHSVLIVCANNSSSSGVSVCVSCVVVFACAEEILNVGGCRFSNGTSSIETSYIKKLSVGPPFFNEYFVDLLL